nr:DUF1853 family protein [Zunongwangia sp. SCSIO 43204]
MWKQKDAAFDLQIFALSDRFPATKDQFEIAEKVDRIFVLGKRAERFFEFQIQHSEKYDLRISNLQIIQHKKTLGELDFIVEEKDTGQLIHIELVYKFYVYDPSYKEELARWIGPNRKDSLLEKVEKLKTRQLPLLHNSETKQILNSKHISTRSISQQVCYKANLFVPRKLQYNSFSSINNDCIIGFWIHFSEFESDEFSQSKFFSPSKQFWPVDPAKNDIWLSYSEIFPQIRSFIQQKRSPLLWMKTKDTFERFFVVWW